MPLSTTGQTIITGALKLLQVIEEGETPQAPQLADGLERLNELIDWLGTQRLAAYLTARTTVGLTASVSSYTIGPGGTINQVRPEAIERAAYIAPGTTNEVEMGLYSAQQYAFIPDKTLTSALPYAIYYAPASPLGSLTVYPTPTTAPTLVLYVRTLLTEMDLSTPVTFPAGYAKMLRYQLAKAWGSEFGNGLKPDDVRIADEALADVKRKNVVIHAMAGDSAISGIGGHYDILSDQNL